MGKRTKIYSNATPNGQQLFEELLTEGENDYRYLKIYRDITPGARKLLDDINPGNELDLGELRYSYGVGVTWITQLGPMSLAIAAPSNEGPLDETENFQFEIGTQF